MNVVNLSEVVEQARQLKINALPIKKIDCLNLGSVELLDWLGTDHDLAESARVSYQEGTKKTSNDNNLISRLIRKKHTSPLEQGVLKFKIKAPVFVIIQILRHRTARINSESGRYSELRDEFYIPELSRIQTQSQQDKQGSGSELDLETQQKVLEIMLAEQKQAKENYQEYLAENVARELARINIPLSVYMNFVWQIDLHNMFNFLRLRLDNHAQYEIQVYARALYKFTKLLFPLATNNFEEHILHAYTFSKTELGIIRDMVKHYQTFVIPSIKDIAEREGLKSTRLNDFLNVLGLENG